VLGELLHSLSQPLTGLLCSLELSLQLPLDCSIEQIAEQQQANVSVALQQTEKVIGMIQLMREYLDAEQPGPEAWPAALAPAMRSVIEELSSIAAVRGVQLRLVGTCTATVPVPESRLRLALQYLIATLIEAQPVGGKVMLLLGEGPAGAVLRAEGEPGFRGPNFREQDFRDQEQSARISQTKRDPAGATSTSVPTLRRVRLAIASRVLETAGASLVFGDGDHAAVGPTGFVLRIPRRFDAPAR
jgi:signal transduction histidine kinase